MEYLVKIEKLKQEITADCEPPSSPTHVQFLMSKSKVRGGISYLGTPDFQIIYPCRRWKCYPATNTLYLNGRHPHLHLGRTRFDHRRSRLLLGGNFPAQNVETIFVLLLFSILRVIFTVVPPAAASQSHPIRLSFFIVYSFCTSIKLFWIGNYPTIIVD